MTARCVGVVALLGVLVGCGSDGDDSDQSSSGGTSFEGTGARAEGGSGGEPSGGGPSSGGTASGTGGQEASGGEESTGGNPEPGDCGDSVLITYETSGRFHITDTPFSAGDGSYDVGPGEVVIRFTDSDGDGEPDEGAVAVLVSYEMTQSFVQSGVPSIDTQTVAQAGPEACGVAHGELQGSDLVWDTCTYGAGHGTTDWLPTEASASGAGCIADYSSTGTVECSGALCGLAGLPDGEPASVEGNWTQPLNTFAFGSDWSGFTMGSAGGPGGEPTEAVEIPNDMASRTWIGLEGTETRRTTEPMPECLCD